MAEPLPSQNLRRPELRLLPSVAAPAVREQALLAQAASRDLEDEDRTSSASSGFERSIAADEVGPTVLLPPPNTTYIATESVLLLCVALPEMSAAQRRAACAYAVEDRIAQPLDQVHVVAGPPVPGRPGHWLVAVVAHSVVLVAPPGQDVLLPDVMALPVPEAGEWSVLVIGGRALVRLPDLTGFAVDTTLLPAFWRAGGEPAVVLYGGTLPPEIAVRATVALPALPDGRALGLNLRAGRHALRGAGVPRGLRSVITILVVAVVGHLALLTLDVTALRRTAVERETALRATLVQDGQPVEGSVDDALAAALAARQPMSTGGFLSLLGQALSALAPESGRILLKDLRYTQATETLILTVEGPDLGALQAVETALAASGLAVATGAATTGDGGAEVQMTIGESR